MRREWMLFVVLVALLPICGCVPPLALAERPRVLWSADDPDGSYVIGGITGGDAVVVVEPEVAPVRREAGPAVVELPAAIPFDPAPYAYAVRARGHRLVDGRYVAAEPPPSCTAISVGDGRFLTAGHLIENLQGGIEIDIQVDGRWKNNVPFQKAADRDALTIVTRLDVPSVEVRAPEYRESVVAYGLTSCEPLSGLYCGILATGRPESFVSLDPEERGVDAGDSGGGVFGQDGKLIGLIQGYGAERKNVATVLVADLPQASAFTSARSSVSRPASSASSLSGAIAPAGCRNGQCWRRPAFGGNGAISGGTGGRR